MPGCDLKLAIEVGKVTIAPRVGDLADVLFGVPGRFDQIARQTSQLASEGVGP